MDEDEILLQRLTPQGFEDIENGAVEDDEMLLVLRAMQSAEALELPYRDEEELGRLLDWYYQVQTDQLLIEMMLRGDLFFVGFDENGDKLFTNSPQGLGRVKAEAERRGEPLPEWMSEAELPSLDA